MSFDVGGFASKLGNRYELDWVLKQLIRLLNEELQSVMLETIGDDERGVDVIIVTKSGNKEFHQCKARSGNDNDWSVAELNRLDILNNAHFHFKKDSNTIFKLVSPITFKLFEDICLSVRHSEGDFETLINEQVATRERKKAFTQFCTYLNFDTNNPIDQTLIVHFLSHFYIEQFPDHSKNDLKRELRYLVETNDVEVVQSLLKEFVEKNLRKPITLVDIQLFLSSHNIYLRTFFNDARINPKFESLKEQFKQSIAPQLLMDQPLLREETEAIFNHLEQKNLICMLHGRPGLGKSSILYELTNMLEEKSIFYLPLRLDRIDLGNTTKQLGSNIDLPESPIKCLEILPINQKIVIILDQLDAIRWTNKQSASALAICKTLISEVFTLQNRGYDISVIFSCRTYDLENDPEIKNFWHQNSKDKYYQKIEIKPLSDIYIDRILENLAIQKNQITLKQRDILRNPQHFYIWVELFRQANNTVQFNSVVELTELYINNKFQDINKTIISSNEIVDELNSIIQYLEQNSKVSFPLSLIKNHIAFDRLCSHGLLQITEQKQITFVHQNYLDYFLAKKIIDNVHSHGHIFDWLGDKSQQTLFKREQLRQALAMLYSDSPELFLKEIKAIIENKTVRFHIKHLILEFIGQIDNPSIALLNYLTQLVENNYWQSHILSQVCLKHPIYINHLINKGLIDDWFNNDSKKGLAIWILSSITQSDSELVTKVLSPYLSNKAKYNDILKILSPITEKDSDSLFQIRLTLARKKVFYPDIFWIEFKKDRVLYFIDAVLPDIPMLQTTEYTDHIYNNFHFDDNKQFKHVLNVCRQYPDTAIQLFYLKLSQYWLNIDEAKLVFSVWTQARFYRGKDSWCYYLTKFIIESFKSLIKIDAEQVWQKTTILRKSCKPICNYFLREIYIYMPKEYSDKIIQWYLAMHNKLVQANYYDESQYLVDKKIIKRHSRYLSDITFKQLENYIYFYKDNYIAQYIKRNRHLHPELMNQYYGKIQYLLLPALSPKRISKDSIQLIQVLKRKYAGKKVEFNSPISIKKKSLKSNIPQAKLPFISDRSWMRIIHNKDVTDKDDVKNGFNFEESSHYFFSSDFEGQALKHPQRFANLFLQCSENIYWGYKKAILSAIQKSNKQNDELLEAALIEKLLCKLIKDKDSDNKEIARSICHVVSGYAEEITHTEIINKIKYYAQHHNDPEVGQLNVTSKTTSLEDCSADDLDINVINSVRGWSAIAIRNLLSFHPSFFEFFKPAIVSLVTSSHIVDKAASLSSLQAVLFYIDQEFALQYFIKLVRNDLRLSIVSGAVYFFNIGMKNIKYNKQLQSIVIKMLHSKNDKIIKRAAEEITVRWLFLGYFSNIHFTQKHNLSNLIKSFIKQDYLKRCLYGSPIQQKGLINVTVEFMEQERYQEKCFYIINELNKQKSAELNQRLPYIFNKESLVSNPKSQKFIIHLLKSDNSFNNLYSLYSLLENHVNDLSHFSELLLSALNKELNSIKEGWEISSISSPLLLRLYEQANNNQDKVKLNQCLDVIDLIFEKKVDAYHNFNSLVS